MSNQEQRPVIVTNPFNGLFACNVCALTALNDEEILAELNRIHRSGTTNGWVRVIREIPHPDDNPFMMITEETLPVQCDDFPDRTHYIILC